MTETPAEQESASPSSSASAAISARWPGGDVVTWTKLGDEFCESPRMRRLPRDARYLRVEALVWCNRHGTDGAVEHADLHWITDSPDPDAAVAELVKAGFWAITDAGWQVVGWSREQRLAADVERTNEINAERQRRHRQHANGDHSLCSPKWCRMAAKLDEKTPETSDVTRDETPTRPDLSRPDPTRRNEGGEGGTGRLRLAPLGTSSSLAAASPQGGNARLVGLGTLTDPARLVWMTPGQPADHELAPDDPAELITLSVEAHDRTVDEHRIIDVNAVDPDEVTCDPNQAGEARRVMNALIKDLDHRIKGDLAEVKRTHKCPKSDQHQVACGAKVDLDYDASSLTVAVKPNRVRGCIDLLLWELAHNVRLPDHPDDRAGCDDRRRPTNAADPPGTKPPRGEPS